jgi:hypothetical protein
MDHITRRELLIGSAAFLGTTAVRATGSPGSIWPCPKSAK